jgi:DNA-binding NarL/FixJ family response regulator
LHLAPPGSEKMKIKVLLADDHQILREGLRAMLEKEYNMEVLGEAANGREALRLIREKPPDVIVMDITMPGLNGVEATRQIRNEFPQIKVVALSMHDDKRFVLNMLKAGASAYLLKEGGFKEVVKAVNAVMANKTYLSPDITDVVLTDYLKNLNLQEASVFALLSPREREVLQLIAEGKTTLQIAEVMHVSAKTIETHRHHIMQKLQISSIAELTKYAIREGLTDI